jgi:feruloyl-CoA synthase
MNAYAVLDDPTALAPPVVQRVDLTGGTGGTGSTGDIDGSFVLRSPQRLEAASRCVGEWVEHWALVKPEALAFAEPTADGWTVLDWRTLRRRLGAVAQALLDLDAPLHRPVAVISDNSLDHLVLALAAQHIGRPVCSISSGYSRLVQGDFRRLHDVLRRISPALLYAHDAATYAPALHDAPTDAPRVFSHGALSVPGARPFAELLHTAETPAVMRAFAALTPDTHAKYLLTSGSTGVPKVVINTQRMLTANQQQLAQTLRFLARQPPLLLDWLPWSHTFGANHNLNLVLRHGGTLYIDDGRPAPGLIDKTLAHLQAVQPTLYFNVPRGYDMLLPALEADDALAHRFFDKLQMLFYAGAGLPPSTWQRLRAVAERVRRSPVWFTTAWGSTETAPGATMAHWPLDRPGVIGLPLPGVDLKFTPNGNKLELRVRGPNVFPGYLHDEAATRAAFDDEGYYRIGDAGRLADPGDASQGVVFDGRVAEDFKLGSGTWVSVGTLRLAVVAALSPLAQDVVVCGHERDEIGVLVFPSEAGRKVAGHTLRAAVRDALKALQAQAGGSSKTPMRALVLAEPPALATGEITDKGYINQRAVLQRRAADVRALYDDTDPRVIRA